MRSPYFKKLLRRKLVIEAKREIWPRIEPNKDKVAVAFSKILKYEHSQDLHLIHIELYFAAYKYPFDPVIRFFTKTFDELTHETARDPYPKPGSMPLLMNRARPLFTLRDSDFDDRFTSQDWFGSIVQLSMVELIGEGFREAGGRSFGFPAYASLNDSRDMLNLRNGRWEEVDW